MTTSNSRTRLGAQGYEQARSELDRLLLTHRAGLPRAGEDDAWARYEWRELRIRHLQELLLDAIVGAAPADDGSA